MPIDFAAVAARFAIPVRLQMVTMVAALSPSTGGWTALERVTEPSDATQSLPVLTFEGMR